MARMSTPDVGSVTTQTPIDAGVDAFALDLLVEISRSLANVERLAAAAVGALVIIAAALSAIAGACVAIALGAGR